MPKYKRGPSLKKKKKKRVRTLPITRPPKKKKKKKVNRKMNQNKGYLENRRSREKRFDQMIGEDEVMNVRMK